MPPYLGEPGVTTVKTLFGLSNNVCAFREPETNLAACEERLVDPKWKQVNASICHIRAARPGGPRYDITMTDEERGDFYNLILLCPNHHKLIDNLEPDRFTVQILQAMKEASMSENIWASDDLISRATEALILTIELQFAAGQLPYIDMSEPHTVAGAGATLAATATLGGSYLGSSYLGGSANTSATVDASVSRASSETEIVDIGSGGDASQSAVGSDSSDSAQPAYIYSEDDGGSRRATQIHVRLNGKGYSDGEINGWWNTGLPTLGGFTPNYLWLRHSETDRSNVETAADSMPTKRDF